METEYRATLLHAAAAMRSWCYYLRAAGKYRRLTSTEESILHNAGCCAEDIKRVLCGQQPDDQELRTELTVERMRDDKESMSDKEGSQHAGSRECNQKACRNPDRLPAGGGR